MKTTAKTGTKTKTTSSKSRNPGLPVIFAVFSATLPLLAFALVLLFLILFNSVNHQAITAELAPDGGAEPISTWVFYVKYDATRLMTVASWASNWAPSVPGAVMTLYSLRVARALRESSRMKQDDQLPSPWQLAVLLNMLTGAKSSLYAWNPFRSWRKREKGVAIVNSVGCVFLVAVLLGYGVWAADTWLHVTTKTVSLALHELPSDPKKSYGRALKENCTSFLDFPVGSPCRPSNQFDREPYLVFNNISTSNQILRSSFGSSTYWFMTSPKLGTSGDFTASTTALTSQCQPTGSRCFSQNNQFEINCSELFEMNTLRGNASAKSFETRQGFPLISTWFADAQFTTLFEPSPVYNITAVSPNITAHPPISHSANPFYVGIAGNFPAIDNSMRSAFGSGGSGFQMINNQVLFALTCTVSVYTIEFTMVKGSVVSLKQSIPPPSLANTLLVQSAYSSLGGITDLGNFLGTAAVRASIQDGTASFISSMEEGLGRGILSEMTTALEPATNIREQLHSVVQVARVPMVPLYFFLAVTLLLFLYGVTFSVIAVRYSSPSLKYIRQRLGVDGIVAIWCKVARYDAPDIDVDQSFYEEDAPKESKVPRVGLDAKSNTFQVLL
ncbi:hypothetical protein QQS21_000662 [Conoideocrella luteorostrata]|uniref:Uncharacterized protein n=1 Tax=Conoideocrella luteorostrata TaxID=1105319 RepID=A0AAJ0CZH3_9HYPO|nr:hypothetical protein QQS21_000662 [Conoideocrella luteorostrata]